MNKFMFSIFTVLVSVNAFSWGAKGHQIIAYVGGQSAEVGKTFWQSNLVSLRQLSTVPDRIWKAPVTKTQEAPSHFFQVDYYFTPSEYSNILNFPNDYSTAVSKYSESIIIKNGTAPWRIRQLYQLALKSLKAKDMKSALQYTGTMTHYIGDLSQPLHVSENYDGQLTGNDGIHSYFENKIIVDELNLRTLVQKRVDQLLKNDIFLKQFKGNLMDIILLEIKRSISFQNQVLKNDTELGRNKKGDAVQLELAIDRMADGAATLAVILNKLWKESGLIARASPMTIQDPAWLQTDYSKLDSSGAKALLIRDDCF